MPDDDTAPLPGPEEFSSAPLAILGDANANPALDKLLQLLDVGKVTIGRHSMPDDESPYPEPYTEPQLLTVEVRRRTDGATFSAAMLLSRQMPPAAFKLCLVHLLNQGVDRVKRG